ncbi:MAG: DNA polymerase III subunit delta [Bacteroidales bacterium]|nr:DNA polymerase III subunit delta [Bacteroidales bacterium]
MKFAEVIGQKEIIGRLLRSVNDNRIPHAQLFLGEEGTGSLALAMAYAQYISCGNKNGQDSCGECASCKKYNKLIHPDLHFVFPVNTTKEIAKNPVSDDFIKQWRECILNIPYLRETAWYEYIGIENKQGLISKFESESIFKKLSLKSFESEYKIMIIWKPEKMNTVAANKLLKLIEEPPEKTIFLLVCESTDQMLPTILSRSQIIKIPKISGNDLKIKLGETQTLEKTELDTIVHLADGNYLKALEEIQQSEENANYLEKFIQIMRLGYGRKISEIISWVDEMATLGREKQKGFLSFSLKMIRENFMLNLKLPQLVYLNKKESEFAEKFHHFIKGSNIIQLKDELETAQRHIEQNGNGKIIFMDFSLKLTTLFKK